MGEIRKNGRRGMSPMETDPSPGPSPYWRGEQDPGVRSTDACASEEQAPRREPPRQAPPQRSRRSRGLGGDLSGASGQVRGHPRRRVTAIARRRAIAAPLALAHEKVREEQKTLAAHEELESRAATAAHAFPCGRGRGTGRRQQQSFRCVRARISRARSARSMDKTRSRDSLRTWSSRLE